MHVQQEPDALLSGGQIRGRSPRDGQELPPVAVTSKDGVHEAMRRARVAQVQWSALDPHERAGRLKRLRATLLARAPELSEIMQSEQGKSAAEAYTSEILPSADLFTHWARAGRSLLAPEARVLNPLNFPKKAGILSRRPKGVVVLIAPWNYPLAIPLRTLAPALMAGNAVLFKPSEYAPRIGAALARVFEGLGVEHLVQVVQGDGAVGQALIEANPDHVVFTGSDQSGRKVALACADRLITCSLELGGKDAALVLGDADLERAADGIVWGAFANAGQNCAAIERVYVVETVAGAFIEKVVERTQKLVVGGGGREVFDVGPLVRPAGLATVEQHVADALAQGATLRAGGQRTGEGLHFAPTVLTDVTDDMAVMTAETFGPVLPIAVVKDESEAIARANQSVYGLTVSLWTRDLERGRVLAQQVRTGIATLNNHAFTGAVPDAPWHGRGHSGSGVTNSRFAFYELTEPHYLLVDRARQKELWWFPHTAALADLARNFAALLGGRGRKLSALLGVVRNMIRRWK